MIKDILKKNRPNLGETSINTYSSIIKNLYKKLTQKDDYDEATHYFENNIENVMEFLKDIPPSRRKTTLASVVVFLGDTTDAKKYREQMIKDATIYNQSIKEQKKNGKETTNWISEDEIHKKYTNMEKDIKHLWNKKDLTTNEMNRLMDYVILSLYIRIPPRRLMDYIKFKVRNIDEEKDNYMKKQYFIFNQYKTEKYYGKQEIPITIQLKNIVQRWSKKHDNDYLIFDIKTGNPFTAPKLTQRLNSIFDNKKISVNMLRHVFITENVLKDVPKLLQLQQTATAMGHSIGQQALYKKD
jgi:hypothetical protein